MSSLATEAQYGGKQTAEGPTARPVKIDEFRIELCEQAGTLSASRVPRHYRLHRTKASSSLSQCVCVCVCVCAYSCPTLCKPMDYSSLASSVHGIFQARILE